MALRMTPSEEAAVGEWVRLTPEDGDLAPAFVKQYHIAQGDANVRYGLAYGIAKGRPDRATFSLSTAELNALARHAPEVKALVEAVDTLITKAPAYLDNEEDVPVELWDPVAAALANIKGASDG